MAGPEPSGGQVHDERDAVMDERDLQRRLKAVESENLVLRAGLARMKGDFERIGESQAWRWGHRAASLLGRLRGRRYDTAGAVRAAGERIAWLEASLGEAVITGRQVWEISDDPRRRWSFCVKISAPNAQLAPTWGDLHFGEALARELNRRGHRAVVQTRSHWEDVEDMEHDVVILLRGSKRYPPKPRHFNVLWNISHPDELAGSECDRYDLVAVASESFAAKLRSETSTPVVVLEQATDARRFFPEPRPKLAHELLFVGKTRGVRRKILADLLPTDHELAVYGAGWRDVIDGRHVVAEHIPNEQLRHAYSSAGIVLNDHWDDMRAEGYLSNRLYDAVACGAVVISDPIPGLERFGGAVLAYESREELRALIEWLLADPAERAARGAAGRRRILEGHTFAHRADTLLDALQGHLAPARDRSGRLLRLDEPRLPQAT